MQISNRSLNRWTQRHRSQRGRICPSAPQPQRGVQLVEGPGFPRPEGPRKRNHNPSQPYTNEINQHTPSGWCVYSKFDYGDVDNLLRLYRGKDCIGTFRNYIKGEAHRLYHMFSELPMDPLTKKQWKKYKKATSVTFVTNHLH